jgi:hypothetical protein
MPISNQWKKKSSRYFSRFVDSELVPKQSRQICRHTFGLSFAVLRCSPSTSLDEFATDILVWGQDGVSRSSQEYKDTRRLSSRSEYPSTRVPTSIQDEAAGRIADVIIATRLNEAQESVQIQALEARLPTPFLGCV